MSFVAAFILREYVCSQLTELITKVGPSHVFAGEARDPKAALGVWRTIISCSSVGTTKIGTRLCGADFTGT
jgi:hypothetical protein